ncbi:NlpC/P60 family protein [Streptomyces sp. NPDC005202]|uniref:C40 family peptidase n=1 Tax=Streptomyces sp. NPDC005202 TaxID=3157021 RepID=UPI0033B6E1B2
MASERTSRPGGISLPGMRNSALTTAAGDNGPSRDEVQQRISSLYDQAETATGNYNATRAMSKGGRTRLNSAAGNGSRRTDPLLESVAKQWFDVARAQLGPTVPAVLPADRMPGPERSRPAGPARRPADGLGERGREATPGPSVLELTAGPATTAMPIPELTAGPATTAMPIPELTAGPATTVTAGPVAESAAGPLAALPSVFETRAEPARVVTAPVAQPRQPALRSSKEQFQRKLTQARALLSQHAAQQSVAPAAIEAPPAEESWLTSGESWLTPYQGPEQQYQQSAGLGVTLPVDAGMALAPGTAVGPEQALDTALSLGSPASTGTAAAVGIGDTAGSTYERKAAKALAFARAQIGRPCVWGATGPDSYDCSSLTQAAWRAAGVVLPRTAYDQAGSGTPIPLAELWPGDLIFFYGDAGHVGLYAGNGMMVHAPSPGASIREESIFYAGPQAIHSAVRPA